MKKIFVCSPYRGEKEKNTKNAAFAARIICGCGNMPIVPHLYFTQFLEEDDPVDRIRGIKLGIELMKSCELIWLIGTKISKGMEYELKTAKEMQIPVKLYDDKLRQIDPKTLDIDDRVDDFYRNAIEGLKLE